MYTGRLREDLHLFYKYGTTQECDYEARLIYDGRFVQIYSQTCDDKRVDGTMCAECTKLKPRKGKNVQRVKTKASRMQTILDDLNAVQISKSAIQRLENASRVPSKHLTASGRMLKERISARVEYYQAMKTHAVGVSIASEDSVIKEFERFVEKFCHRRVIHVS